MHILVGSASSRISTLQDDVGSMYSVLAYPLIHDLENQMRKLISKFMTINMGRGWFQNTIHADIKKVSDSTNRQPQAIDFLQTVDFIELTDVLFKAYRSTSVTATDNYILELKVGELADVNFLKNAIPRSNWERHFSKILNIDGDELKDKWKKLYILRCEIAHNRYFSKSKYDQLTGLRDSIQDPINKALENLDKIKLTQQDVELIANSVIAENEGVIILFKAVKNLNVGIATAVEFLSSIGYEVENKPTTKLTHDMYEALKANFKR